MFDSMSLNLHTRMRFVMTTALLVIGVLTITPLYGENSPVDGSLIKYFLNNKDGRLIHKWLPYFEIYEKHFARFRGTDVVVLEIGVSHGGSLQMWKKYFGPKARIIGVDIDKRCKSVEESQIEVFIGDQADPAFWSKFKKAVPRVDIVIDDGGHTMKQQITTFENLFSHVSPRGIYICEDLHTSYMKEFGGALRKKDTFIEMAKGLIDDLTAWHSEDPEYFKISSFTKSAHSITFYDSLVAIEKRPMTAPVAKQIGKPSW